MINKQHIKQLAEELFSKLPDSLQYSHQALMETFQSVLSKSFQKMDLVTREEFDTQVKLLHRLEEKMMELNKTSGGKKS